MRDTGRKRWIERVDVERDVDGTIELQLYVADQVTHLDRLNAKLPYLLALISSERPDSHLHQARRELLFHDARERRRMRITIALKAVVNVGMRVEMKNVEVFILARKRSDDGVRDRGMRA